MGEEVADEQWPQLAELQARLEREFAQIAPAATASPAPASPAAAAPSTEPRDAAHG
jgi:hypothetical protein